MSRLEAENEQEAGTNSNNTFEQPLPSYEEAINIHRNCIGFKNSVINNPNSREQDEENEQRVVYREQNTENTLGDEPKRCSCKKMTAFVILGVVLLTTCLVIITNFVNVSSKDHANNSKNKDLAYIELENVTKLLENCFQRQYGLENDLIVLKNDASVNTEKLKSVIEHLKKQLNALTNENEKLKESHLTMKSEVIPDSTTKTSIVESLSFDKYKLPTNWESYFRKM